MLTHLAIDHETRRFAVELLTQLLGDEPIPPRLKPENEPNGHVFVFGEFTFDPRFRRVSKGKLVIALTLREYELLAALAARSGAPVSKASLRSEVWKNTIDSSSRSIDQHVAELRKKLPSDERRSSAIVTVRKYGYALNGEWIARPEAERRSG